MRLFPPVCPAWALVPHFSRGASPAWRGTGAESQSDRLLENKRCLGEVLIKSLVMKSAYVLLFTAVVFLFLTACASDIESISSPTAVQKKVQEDPSPVAPTDALFPTATEIQATLTPAPNPIPYRTPYWFQNAIIYEIFVRSFADSDGDGIGDHLVSSR
jgi:hypothetical protein